MSDFFHPMTEQVSRKQRRCIYCYEHIDKGDLYRKQSGVWEGMWFTSDYHPECWDAFGVDGWEEFLPHSNDRPKKVSTP